MNIIQIGLLFLLTSYSGISQTDIVNQKALPRIAYNVYLPDSSKGNWEIMKMNFDGSDKKKHYQ